MKNFVLRKFCGLLIIVLLFGSRPATAPALTGPLNINSATARQLQELPLIGAKRAQAIVAYRRSHGPFHSLDQLLEVDDIGEKSLEAIRPYLAIADAPSQAKLPAVTTVHRQITTSEGEIIVLPDDHYFTALVDYLKSAKHSIDLTMFLFKTTDSAGNKPALLLKELIAARRKGVDIRVVLENSGYDASINRENKRVAGLLRKNNIRVLFDSPDTTTHAKIVVIDRRYSFIGSHNLTHAALAYNHEVSLLIDNQELAARLTAYMDGLH
ncbi:MAG: phospholipase D-like domain-containing protein [Thermodesulfobacteriota bacterium]